MYNPKSLKAEEFICHQEVLDTLAYDYFDVSLDYIFARTDKPQGVIYEFKPKAAPEREEMRRFIEMCFDPQSPMNEKLKETLFRMMEENR